MIYNNLVCEVCGKEFDCDRPKKTCSPECHEVHQVRRAQEKEKRRRDVRRGLAHVQPCKICGRGTIVYSGQTQDFCCEAHARKWAESHKVEEPKPDKPRRSHRRKAPQTGPRNTLVEDSIQAHQMGMTYGQLQAWRYRQAVNGGTAR